MLTTGELAVAVHQPLSPQAIYRGVIQTCIVLDHRFRLASDFDLMVSFDLHLRLRLRPRFRFRFRFCSILSLSLWCRGISVFWLGSLAL